MPIEDISELFLPYQKNWLKDVSRFKLASKTRRSGFTWTQAFEDVKDALSLKVRNKPIPVWFTSSNFDNALEYILYCKDWATTLNTGFEDLGIELLDLENDVRVQSIKFENGARITGLSSNPKVLRGKGGKLVIDEFAFHENQNELWRAGKPVITWGYPLRIISSVRGVNLFYKFIQLVKQGKLNWSLHEVDIFKAVQEGLADKILDRPLTEAERQEWIAEEKKSCADEITWLQEYCCQVVDDAVSFISYDLIHSACIDNCINESLNDIKGEIYIGYDVARIKDLSVVAVFEKLGNVFYLRKLIELKNIPFVEQKMIVRAILSHPKARKLAIDATGIGRQMAEELTYEFGKRMVDSVTFTLNVKEELAYKLLYAFQDRNIKIFDNEKLKVDIHSVKRIPTTTGVIKFDCNRAETDGHADRFWALALGIFAGTNEPYQKPIILSAKPKLYKDFNGMLNLGRLGGFLRGGMF